jgi:rhamnosyltransferase subunit B
MQLTSFPLYDEANVRPLTTDQAAFLDAGTPPVVATFGTAMRHALPYFTAIAEGLSRAGLRGILLTPHREQVPSALPPGVIHLDYVPLSLLLPKCAVMVHHGGIGTASQALKAGIPQLIMPMTHDQPDNALRLHRLGVAEWLKPTQFTSDRIARVLQQMTTAVKLANEDGLAATADMIARM